LFYAFGQSKWAFSETQANCEQVGVFKFYFMKTIELQKMQLDELKSDELLKFDGGHGIIYYLSYDIGFLLGTTAKVAEKVIESAYYGSVTTFLK
jgi:hypothetical protein